MRLSSFLLLISWIALNGKACKGSEFNPKIVPRFTFYVSVRGPGRKHQSPPKKHGSPPKKHETKEESRPKESPAKPKEQQQPKEPQEKKKPPKETSKQARSKEKRSLSKSNPKLLNEQRTTKQGKRSKLSRNSAGAKRSNSLKFAIRQLSQKAPTQSIFQSKKSSRVAAFAAASLLIYLW